MAQKQTIDKILSKVFVNENGCWLYPGDDKHQHGYKRVGWRGSKMMVHIIVYEELNQVCLLKNVVLDHKCRNRACCFPDHLEPVDHKTNVLRGTSFAAVNKVKTHCPKNHPLIEGNLYEPRPGTRQCKRCVLERGYAKTKKFQREKAKSIQGITSDEVKPVPIGDVLPK